MVSRRVRADFTGARMASLRTSRPMNTPRASLTPLLACALLALVVVPTRAQEPATRVEAIERARREKMARLWPERESPTGATVKRLVDRGLGTGLESGKGVNGPQIVLGGMRSGQGVSFGVGYRRADLWHERFDVRATARGTPQLAYMLDAELGFNSLRSDRSFAKLYVKFEHSPQMDYFGQGNESSADDRSSYLLEDLAVDTNLGLTVFRGLRLGLTAGVVSVHTGPGKRNGVPKTEDHFPLETLPGLEADSDFGRWGSFLALDYRDNPYGPRSGGILAARFRQYADVTRHVYSFRQTDLEFQQFIPYYNRSRVIALRLAAVMTFSDNDASVPIYFQPTLGGNDDLRGYARYRFHDNHTIFASVEHRWYVFSGLDMAVFADAGKAVPHKSQLNAAELRYSGGIGFRAKFKNATIMRIDFAQGREGFRAMWTFSDIFKVNY